VRTTAHVLLGFLWIVFLSAIWRVTPFAVIAPDVTVLIALYLGLTAARSSLPPAVLGAILLGWLADVVLGSPRGIGALAAGVTCFACRALTGRLLLRGATLLALFAFLGALLSQLVMVLVKSYLGAEGTTVGRQATVMLGSALMTGAIAPLVFRMCRAVDAKFARTEREREALREGYLT
jgi:rod shape-determining protein MreD